VDIRKSLLWARPADGEERCLLAENLGWIVTDEVLAFASRVSSDGSARPVEVVEAFFGEGAAAGEIVRLGLGEASAETAAIELPRADCLQQT
jgi:hypothetical protein